MIRYVVAIVLTVALLGAGFAGLEYAASTKGDQQAAAAVSDIEQAAESLYHDDEAPPVGIDGPRRILEIDLPERSLTSNPIDFVELRRVGGEPLTVVEYRVEAGATHAETIDAPIVSESGGDVVTMDGTGTERLRLTLVRDGNGHPVVELARPELNRD